MPRHGDNYWLERIAGALTATGGQTVNLTQVGGTNITLGQKASSASLPVVLPSDQNVPVQGVAAHDAAASGNPLLEGGYASDTAPSDVADGDAVRAWNKRNGARATYDAYKLDATNDAVTSYPFGHTSTYISTATTTTIKTGAGILHTITVNGGTAGTVIVYDNTAGSGTIIASFDSTNALATYTLNVAFTTGLTIVTGAATKITVSSR